MNSRRAKTWIVALAGRAIPSAPNAHVVGKGPLPATAGVLHLTQGAAPADQGALPEVEVLQKKTPQKSAAAPKPKKKQAAPQTSPEPIAPEPTVAQEPAYAVPRLRAP